MRVAIKAWIIFLLPARAGMILCQASYLAKKAKLSLHIIWRVIFELLSLF